MKGVKLKLIRYLVFGALLNAIGFLIYAFLVAMFHYLFALIITAAFSIPASAYTYWRWVFQKRSKFIASLGRYALTTIYPTIANFVMLPVLVEIVQLHPLVAQALIVVTSALIMFLLGYFFSFKAGAEELD